LPQSKREVLNKITFIIIDDNQNNVLKTKAVAESFQGLEFVDSASNYDEGLDCILEHKPEIVFLGIDSDNKKSDISLGLINELYRFLPQIPRIIITSTDGNLAYEAIKYGVFDYLIQPIQQKDIRKTIARLNRDFNSNTSLTSNVLFEEKVIRQIINAPEEDYSFDEDRDIPEPIEEESNEFANNILDDDIIEEDTQVKKPSKADQANQEITFSAPVANKPLIICVKSYGDYRYINAIDVCYLQADNNSTDIHLSSGEMITAFKTLKHFEGVLNYPFVRIHNSYIVNIDFVSRIHTGNAVCHIKDTTTKLPFSKSYKENIDTIITTIASGNYLEI
jgi:DNA-binding LytR/AlgR family response regulator